MLTSLNEDNPTDKPILLKILLIGDTGVGKSWFVNIFLIFFFELNFVFSFKFFDSICR